MTSGYDVVNISLFIFCVSVHLTNVFIRATIVLNLVEKFGC